MKGLPLSDMMVREWLEKRKSVHRVLMNPQPLKCEIYEKNGCWHWSVVYADHSTHGGGFLDYILQEMKSRFLPGETVYIKETWAPYEPFKPVIYKADRSEMELSIDDLNGVKWRSPCFMPEWASRSKALIVSARPERIQDITPCECIKEGFFSYMREHDACCDLLDQFKGLWDTLHPGSWKRNDWVFRYELKEVK